MGVHLMSVHLMGVHLMGVHLMGVHLMGVHTYLGAGICRRVFYRRAALGPKLQLNLQP